MPVGPLSIVGVGGATVSTVQVREAAGEVVPGGVLRVDLERVGALAEARQVDRRDARVERAAVELALEVEAALDVREGERGRGRGDEAGRARSRSSARPGRPCPPSRCGWPGRRRCRARSRHGPGTCASPARGSSSSSARSRRANGAASRLHSSVVPPSTSVNANDAVGGRDRAGRAGVDRRRVHERDDPGARGRRRRVPGGVLGADVERVRRLAQAVEDRRRGARRVSAAVEAALEGEPALDVREREGRGRGRDGAGRAGVDRRRDRGDRVHGPHARGRVRRADGGGRADAERVLALRRGRCTRPGTRTARTAPCRGGTRSRRLRR